MFKFIKSVFGASDATKSAPPAQGTVVPPRPKKFTQFQTVSCAYGTGYIAEVRDDCYVVLLTNWALAQGQSPTLYLQEAGLTAIPGAFPGTTVKTPYGLCYVESIRSNGTHVCRPINWKLANTSIPTLYLQPNQVFLTQSSGFTPGDEVMTCYGRGFVKHRTEVGLVVLLNNWKLAQGQSPTCHLEEKSCVKVNRLDVGSIAKTCWGLVKILEHRRDGTYVCQAMHWTLADGSAARLYLAPEAFALMSLKPCHRE